MLTVEFLNDRTGTNESANYVVTVHVNGKVLHKERLEGHPRDAGWLTLVRRLVSSDGTLDGMYCGVRARRWMVQAAEGTSRRPRLRVSVASPSH